MPETSIDPATGREVLLTEAFSYNGQYKVKAKGYRGTATAGETSDVDFAVGSEDRYINGLKLLLVNHAEADTLVLQVCDKDELIPEPARAAFPSWPLLDEFGSSWNVDHEVSDQGTNSFPYTARLPAGMYLRIKYTSTGESNVVVKLNTLLHKKVA